MLALTEGILPFGNGFEEKTEISLLYSCSKASAAVPHSHECEDLSIISWAAEYTSKPELITSATHVGGRRARRNEKTISNWRKKCMMAMMFITLAVPVRAEVASSKNSKRRES